MATVLFPQPAGPVTIKIWWFFGANMKGAVFTTVEEALEGETEVEIGGVGALA